MERGEREPRDDRDATAASRSRSSPPQPDGWTLERMHLASAVLSGAEGAGSSGPTETWRAYGVHDGDTLALVARMPSPVPRLDLSSEMSERFELGDYSGCMRAAELLLKRDPSHRLASQLADQSRQKLEALYTSRLSISGRVPQLSVSEEELPWLDLDEHAGALLSCIGRVSDFESLIEACGMPRLVALRSWVALVQAKVVRLV